jgi:hypothetical protein
MLDKLDAHFLFLPQLEMTIDGRRNDKVRAVGDGGSMNEPNTRVAVNRRTV